MSLSLRIVDHNDASLPLLREGPRYSGPHKIGISVREQLPNEKPLYNSSKNILQAACPEYSLCPYLPHVGRALCAGRRDCLIDPFLSRRLVRELTIWARGHVVAGGAHIGGCQDNHADGAGNAKVGMRPQATEKSQQTSKTNTQVVKLPYSCCRRCSRYESSFFVHKSLRTRISPPAVSAQTKESYKSSVTEPRRDPNANKPQNP